MDRKKIIKNMLHEFFGTDTSKFTKVTEVIITYHDIDIPSLTDDAKRFNGEFDEEKHTSQDNMIAFDFLDRKNANDFIYYVSDHYDIVDIKDQGVFR